MSNRGLVLFLSVIALCSVWGRQDGCYALKGTSPMNDDCLCSGPRRETDFEMSGPAGDSAALPQVRYAPLPLFPPDDFDMSLPAEGRGDSRGTDFVIAYPDNWEQGEAMLIVTGDVLTSGTVDIPGINWSESFTVQPCHPAQVLIPQTAQIRGSGTVSHLGIHVTTDNSVSVYFLSLAVPVFTNDACLALPSDVLGKEYIALGYPGLDSRHASQFTIVATSDSTRVTITPSALTLCGKPAWVPFDIQLDRFDAYQLQGVPEADLSGSEVVSTEPVAVFSGARCALVPTFPTWYCCCDFLVEQMTPISTWGQTFLTSDFSRPPYTRGDPLRVLASEDSTTVTFVPPVSGSPFTLDRGEFIEATITDPTEILASKPVLVAQYATGQLWAGVLGDPLEVLVAPTEGFLRGYSYLTPAGYLLDFTSIVVPTLAIGSLLLDGNPVSPSIFLPIGTTGYSYGTVAVSDGCHVITADQPFAIYIYGWDEYVSYGYLGGLRVPTIPCLVTGGGWIPGEPPGPGSKRTFGFNAHSQGEAVWGQLQFIDHATKLKVHSDTVRTLVIHEGDTMAGFSGDCRVREHGGQLVLYTFECRVMDRGEPGRGIDSFGIDVYAENGNLYYSAGGILGGGNIQIHELPSAPFEKGDFSKGGSQREHEPEEDPDLPHESVKGRETLASSEPVSWASPNPSGQFTVISYRLPIAGSRELETGNLQRVSLKVYDLSGRLVKVLVDDALPTSYSVSPPQRDPALAGLPTSVVWDGRDEAGRQVSSGVYFYRLVAGEPLLSGVEVFTDTKKLLVLR